MTSFFPAAYSTLSPPALAEWIGTQYGWTDVQCQFLVRGVGDTYLIETPGNNFILRVYRSTHRTLGQIRMETNLLQTLKQANISVSYPIPDLSGEVVHTLNAIEGQRQAVLFSYAPGKAERILNKSQLHSLGTQMALFHNVSSTIQLEQHRWTFDPETTLFTPLQQIKKNFTDIPEDYAWLEETVKKLATLLQNADSCPFSTGYCHFDFLPKNFHFENDQVTFFDFDFMGYGWLVNDLMTFWQHLQLDAYMRRMKQEEADSAFAVFLSAYREQRRISDSELELIPYLSLGFWLFYMGFHTTHDQFFQFTQPPFLKAYTGFLRHIAEHHYRFIL